MRPYRPCLAGLLLLAAAGCAPHPAPPPPPHGGRRHAGGAGGGDAPRPPHVGLFVSPMGEPFRGVGGGEVLVTRWFDGADSNHDGRLTLAEFRADALRFFKILDTDGDGEIAPDELVHYETVILPETSGGGSYDGGGGRRGGGGGHRGGGGHHGGLGGGGMSGGGIGGGGMSGGGMSGGGIGGDDTGSFGGGGGGGGAGGPQDGDPSQGDSDHPQTLPPEPQGAARFGFLGLPEPVSAADSNLNRGVSVPEFLAAATQRFTLLDADHNGVLTRAELPKYSGGGGGGRRPR